MKGWFKKKQRHSKTIARLYLHKSDDHYVKFVQEWDLLGIVPEIHFPRREIS